MAENKSTVIGTFEGECADANITNLNGLDITRPVWENVFASEEYAKAIELGHYIGYLGHPDDTACQDYEHACIVMTEGHIDDNGKIYGKFNLIDTPVGRIVKSFIDAGVTFGISVRGAGDIIDNSVDPDTFVFRGFDLVTFPAYPDSIPTFTPVAASSDVAQQKKYKNVCAAVHNNIDQINSVEAIEVMKTCVAAQSDPYKDLDKRQKTLESDSMLAKKLDVATDMYLAASRELRESRRVHRQFVKDTKRKIRRIDEIMSSQQSRLANQIVLSAKNHSQRLRSLKNELNTEKEISASLKSKNLNYKREIQAATDKQAAAEAKLAEMQSKMRETVTASLSMQSKTSNLDAENQRLNAELAQARSRLSEFQNAYCQLYASATGGRTNVAVTASMSVSDVRRSVSGSAAQMPTFVTVEDVDICDEDNLITI